MEERKKKRGKKVLLLLPLPLLLLPLLLALALLLACWCLVSISMEIRAREKSRPAQTACPLYTVIMVCEGRKEHAHSGCLAALLRRAPTGPDATVISIPFSMPPTFKSVCPAAVAVVAAATEAAMAAAAA